MKLLLCLLLLVLLPTAAFAEEAPEGATSESAEVEAESQSKTITIDLSEKQVPVLEEEVLVKRDNIVITAKSIDFTGFFGPSIRLEVENNNDFDVTIEAPQLSVNGAMVRTLFTCDVLAGKKAVTDLILLAQDLERSGIETVKDIDMRFHVLQSDTWETHFYSNPVLFSTQVEGDFEQIFHTEGFLAAENDSVQVIFQKLKKDETGALLQVYIQNKSKNDITVTLQDVSVNDYMMEPVFSCDVMAGKVAFDAVVFLNTEIEKNELDSFERMECVVHAYESGTWQNMLHSDPVVYEFP